jgi:CBS domain-containing protein
MPIHELCFNDPVSVLSEASLLSAAKKMKKNQVGALVVVDGLGRAVGMLTDRDIVIGAVADEFSLNSRVGDFMSVDLLTVPQDSGVSEVIQQMSEREVRRVVVVDKKNVPCGVVSTDNLLELLGQELNNLGKMMGNQVQNSTENRRYNYF